MEPEFMFPKTDCTYPHTQISEAETQVNASITDLYLLVTRYVIFYVTL